MFFNIKVRTPNQNPDVKILDLSGNLTVFDRPWNPGKAIRMLQDTARDLLRNGCRRILVNLSAVKEIDKSGLDGLLGASVGYGSGEFKILISPAQTRDDKIMGALNAYIGGLADKHMASYAFKIFNNETDAVESFSAGPSRTNESRQQIKRSEHNQL